MSKQQFDVFLCHNNEDKPGVIKIAQQLQENNIKPWLDRWELRPGLPWQRALEEQITQIKSAAIFIGPNGIGPWQNQEIDAFLREFVKRECPVIPIMLPNAPAKPTLPVFLDAMMWVDFCQPDPDPLSQLVWGITGENRLTQSQIPAKQSCDKDTKKIPSVFSFKPQLKTFKFQYTEIKSTKRKIIPFGKKLEFYKVQKQAKYFLEDLGGGIDLEMVLLPNPEKTTSEAKSQLNLAALNSPSDTAIFMSKYLITQSQWKAVSRLPEIDQPLLETPSKFIGKDLPVENVSLFDAIEFCKRLSRKFYWNYRLPTEAEWECACRGGTKTKFNFGDVIDNRCANFLDKRSGSRTKSTTPVGHFAYPNSFGLYDMHGNVYEWCLNQGKKPSSVIRGGSWRDLEDGCTSSHRSQRDGREKSDFIGFRIACFG
jgi:formylglycine-generating enzyme required for sulfatase activity